MLSREEGSCLAGTRDGTTVVRKEVGCCYLPAVRPCGWWRRPYRARASSSSKSSRAPSSNISRPGFCCARSREPWAGSSPTSPTAITRSRSGSELALCRYHPCLGPFSGRSQPCRWCSRVASKGTSSSRCSCSPCSSSNGTFYCQGSWVAPWACILCLSSLPPYAERPFSSAGRK